MNTIPLKVVTTSITMAKRETIGQCVQKRRKELGLTRPELAARAAAYGKVSESFVRDLELDRFPSPGIKGLEAVARALDMAPLDLIARGLEQTAPIASDPPAYDQSRFARLARLYSQIESKRLRAVVDETLQMLIDRLKKG